MNSWVLAGTLLAFVSVSQGVDPGDDLGNNLNTTGPHGYYPWSSRTFRLQRGTKAFFPSSTLPRGFPPRGYVDAPVFAGAAGAVAIDQFAGFGIGSSPSGAVETTFGVHDRARVVSMWRPAGAPVDGVLGTARRHTHSRKRNTAGAMTQGPRKATEGDDDYDDDALHALWDGSSAPWYSWTIVVAAGNVGGWLRVNEIGSTVTVGKGAHAHAVVTDLCTVLSTMTCRQLYAVRIADVLVGGGSLGVDAGGEEFPFFLLF
eukprot:TRINITY_DN4975_c0_g4_i1.p1 TRINITY_DN4975_c0_g4~~TRINITY_DN4975_c0_g4_i1.p1  ORF type:complete len:268 (-),score=76.33 TRINITY_DN4975_c0_g4_i1:173-949(-)